MTRCSVAIVAGTGCRSLMRGLCREELRIRTADGSVDISVAYHAGACFAILHRHGTDHTVPPHSVRHDRNMAALQSLGVRRIVALNAVGSLRADLPVGSLVSLSDFVALHATIGPSRPNQPVRHADVSTPYCSAIRDAFVHAMGRRSDFIPNGTLIGVTGPRYETPAEVQLFARLGGDVVGMTGAGEAVAAREAALCYAALACVTNLGVGLSHRPLAHDSVSQTMDAIINGIRYELMEAVTALVDDPESQCACPHAHSSPPGSSPTRALNS